jgi:hypothetical protein
VITTQTRIVAIVGSVLLLLLIVELVRRRRLKEEYSLLWVAIAVVMIVLAASTGPLHWLTSAIGAFSESSALYFFGLLLAVFLLLHFSVRVSLLERRLTALIQEIALLNASRQSANGTAGSNGTDAGATPDVDDSPTRAHADPNP